MRRTIILLIYSSIFLATGCSKLSLPEKVVRSENFSFVFRQTPCGSTPLDIFDSSKNQLTHTPIGEKEPIVISLQLTDKELEAIYQKAMGINFFNLPDKLAPPDNMVHITSAPAGTYELIITNGENNHSVYWKSNIITDPLFDEADQFLDLIFFIDKIIRSQKEYQQLSEPRVGCA